MISFTGKPGEKDCKIQFSPRPAFKDKAQDLERKLVYGHRCPTCGNVIQAFFRTDEPVDLWMYEETAFISKSGDERKFGTVNKYVPNEESKPGYSQYDSTFQNFFKPGTQHLLLRNHLLQYKGIGSTNSRSDDKRHVVSGGHPCAYTGCFSRREDLMVRDLYLLWGAEHVVVMRDIKSGDLPTFAEISSSQYSATQGLRVIPAYGDAPPILSFPIEKVQTTTKSNLVWQLNSMAYYIRRDRKKEA